MKKSWKKNCELLSKFKFYNFINSLQILCKGFPPEFSTYLTYTRSLKFDEKPEYSYCKYIFIYFRKLFKNLMEKSAIEND